MNKYLILGLAMFVFITGCTQIMGSDSTTTDINDSTAEEVFDEFDQTLIDETDDIDIGSLI